MDAPSFSLDPESGGKDTTFHVDAGKLAEGRNVTWDFGDGTFAFGAAADHRFGFTHGVVTITMIVTDADGTQAIATRAVTLGTGENAAPNVTLTAGKAWVEVGRPVNLTSRGTDPDGDPLSYLWTYTVVSGGVAGDGHAHDHGDGDTPPPQGEFVLASTESKASVAFDAPGRYLVKVRVTDPKGGEATAEKAVDVSKRIPDAVQSVTFTGTLAAGTGGEASVSETLWAAPAPDSFVDAARHAFQLKYPAATLVMLTWNDTTGQGVTDLDFELRDAAGAVVASGEQRAPAPAMEMHLADLPPGDYSVVVRNAAGASVDYALVVQSRLKLTPDLVAQVEG